MFQSPKSLGFSPEAELRDRSQLLLLANLVRQGADRFILKGGMAMRALYGSARLTKDIDFDAEASISQQSMRSQVGRALETAARQAGLTAPVIKQTKAGESASKWRLEARLPGGVPMTFEVEVSRRGVPDAEFIASLPIIPPMDYRMARFTARAYTATAMAAAKVNALLSPNRNVPRDIHDLFDLIQHDASPVPLWTKAISREALERKRGQLAGKVEGIGYAQAQTELLPYLPPDLRALLDVAQWDAQRARVREQVAAWLEVAIQRAQSAEELGHDPSFDPDLAGR